VIDQAGTGLWAAEAAVISPVDSSGVPEVHSIPGRHDFKTELEAQDYIITAAKKWIEAVSV
jgi:hypothetical protein